MYMSTPQHFSSVGVTEIRSFQDRPSSCMLSLICVSHPCHLIAAVVGHPDEPGQGGGQRRGHVGAEGQERGPGRRGHRATEPGHRCRHPVRPVHLPAGGVRQGTRTCL